MINTILTTLYYVLPGLVANMMPILVRKCFSFLAVPVDFNRRFRGRPIFGSHKTYRGFIFGIIGAIAISFIQMVLFNNGLYLSITYIDYSRISFLLVGFAFGFGALFGDLVKSFFKRRVGMKEGSRFIPWDQLDFVVGIIAFSFLIKPLTWQMALVLLILGPILHVMATKIGYFLKLRKEKW